MGLIQEFVEYAISASFLDDGDWVSLPMNKLNKADNVCIFVDRDDQAQIDTASDKLEQLRKHCEQSDDLKDFKGSMRAIAIDTKNGPKTKVQLNRRPSLSFQIEDLIGTAVQSTS